jgi:hypothetical protein
VLYYGAHLNYILSWYTQNLETDRVPVQFSPIDVLHAHCQQWSKTGQSQNVLQIHPSGQNHIQLVLYSEGKKKVAALASAERAAVNTEEFVVCNSCRRYRPIPVVNVIVDAPSPFWTPTSWSNCKVQRARLDVNPRRPDPPSGEEITLRSSSALVTMGAGALECLHEISCILISDGVFTTIRSTTCWSIEQSMRYP